MRYSGTYAVLLVLHLLTVAFVIGPLAVAPPLSARAARDGRLDALRDHTRTTRVYALASLATVLLGSAMVGLGAIGDQWSMGQLWISASWALWLGAVGLLRGGPLMPLLVETLLISALAWLIGLGIGWLLFGRKRRESFLGDEELMP